MEVLYERCCGIDVYNSSVAACILLERGHKPQKHLRRFGCTTRDLRELAEWLRSFEVRHVANGVDRRVAMEAGTHSIWISEKLQELGHEVIVAKVRELRAISHSDRKSDQVDAHKLAQIRTA